jgi:hypothetical protein
MSWFRSETKAQARRKDEAGDWETLIRTVEKTAKLPALFVP